tara:strand:- start:3767 stop:4387 length:621 start_codon:yes stop_codon:yes gene_type:complete
MENLQVNSDEENQKAIKAVNKIVNKPINELIPYDRNPRVHPDSQIKQLQNSIREWGWTIPILIDEESNVVAGHGRLYAAQDMGIEEVPCVVASGWTEEQRKGYVIADNKLSENGQWNDLLYFSELRSLSDDGYDLTLVGMDDDFSFEDFKPNLDPSFNFQNIGEDDVSVAANKMSDKINNIQKEKSNDGVEVMCPECGETFVVQGY